jgi:hypothetical protein
MIRSKEFVSSIASGACPAGVAAPSHSGCGQFATVMQATEGPIPRTECGLFILPSGGGAGHASNSR